MSLSDDESESVAEELEESLAESLAEEEEDYSEDHYSDDLDLFPEQEPATATATISPLLSSAINLDDLVVSPLPLKTKRVDDTDDYSLSFDEDEGSDSTAYSQDFDVSALSLSRNSPSKKTSGIRMAQGPAKQQAVTFQQPSHVHPAPSPTPVNLTASNSAPLNFPSLAAQSLEAERAMEKLSKEIVYLRNQQRLALKDRREEARNKKLRAEERRKQHNKQLEDATLQVTTLQIEKKNLEEKVGILETTLMGAEEARALLTSALDANKVVLESQKQELQASQEQVTRGEELLAQKEAAWAKERAELVEKLEAQRTRLVSAELHVSLMAKSNEAAEERLARDRSRLPALHQDLLDERLRHLAGVEESARRREEATQCEQAAGLQLIENMRKELHAEMDRREVRMAAEIEDKRAELMKAQQQLRYDIDKHNAQKVEDESQAERRILLYKREERMMLEREKALAQRETEFTVAKKVMEPEMLAAQRDREEARELHHQSERALKYAKQQEERARGRLVELEEREAAVDIAWAQLERERGHMHNVRAKVQTVARGSMRDRALLEDEREKLKGISIALTNQFHVLQQAALLMRTRKPSASAIARGAIASMPPPDFNISSTIGQAMGQVETNKLQLDIVPQFSEQVELLDDEQETKESGSPMSLVVKDDKLPYHENINLEELGDICSPESHLLHGEHANNSRRFSESDDTSHQFRNPRERILQERLQGTTRGDSSIIGVKGNSNSIPANKSWDSLDYSVLSQTAFPPPPPSNAQLVSLRGERNTKENLAPDEQLRFHHDVQSGQHQTQDSAHTLVHVSLNAPGDLVGGVTMTTAAMKSAALRYGVAMD